MNTEKMLQCVAYILSVDKKIEDQEEQFFIKLCKSLKVSKKVGIEMLSQVNKGHKDIYIPQDTAEKRLLFEWLVQAALSDGTIAALEQQLLEKFGSKMGMKLTNVKDIIGRYLPKAVLNKTKRLALVIGNNNYKNAPLQNPVNDARAITSVLKQLGFDIIKDENLNQHDMERAIDEFGEKFQNYDVGLFFYSGHGIQVNGENYLIPTDAKPKSEEEVEYECVKAGRVLAKMKTADKSTNIIILDACRDDPFEKGWSKSTISKGLAVINAPTGSLIAYATAPGEVAYDDDPTKQNSPYTAALLSSIETPNISITEMFQQVRTLVIEKTNGKQTPWESTSLTGNFYFKQE